ncbi:MAG: hypothetical protein HY924_03105 [Elusimicrobia bacterium]|nr:hypothetical protein [Elusimicrobiota bacterium]
MAAIGAQSLDVMFFRACFHFGCRAGPHGPYVSPIINEQRSAGWKASPGPRGPGLGFFGEVQVYGEDSPSRGGATR